MTPQEFTSIVLPVLKAIYESHGKPEPSPTVQALWVGALKRYRAEVVKEALYAHMGRADATYNVVQPNDVALLIEGSPEERSGMAWQKFLQAARSKSPYLSIAFDDPFIHAVVKHMGGWVKLTAEMEEDALEAVRRSFEANYRLFLKSGLAPDTPLRLSGIVENHRILIGRPYEEPVQYAGDRNIARRVAAGEHPALPSKPSAPALPAAANGG